MGVSRGNAQESILVAIDEFWKKNSYPPTIRDIAIGAGLSAKSTGTVWMYLNNLVLDGRIIMRNRRPIPMWVDELIKKKATESNA